MKKYEVLLSESFGVVVEVEDESRKQAEEDAFMYSFDDFKNAKEVHRYEVDSSFVVESKELTNNKQKEK